MAAASDTCVGDITYSEGVKEASLGNDNRDGIVDGTEKRPQSVSTARPSNGQEQAHPDLSNLRLSVILGSLWVRCAKL